MRVDTPSLPVVRFRYRIVYRIRCPMSIYVEFSILATLFARERAKKS